MRLTKKLPTMLLRRSLVRIDVMIEDKENELSNLRISKQSLQDEINLRESKKK